MNILILSCGTRNKIIQYFRSAFKGSLVICADSSPYAPALYEGDAAVVIPKLSEDNYFQSIINICRKFEIRGLISLIDPELELIASYRDRFKEVGVLPMISDIRALSNCFDKAKFANELTNVGVACPKTFEDMGTLTKSIEEGFVKFPLMMKPSCGSASEGLHLVVDLDNCERLFSRYPNMIAQEWVHDVEYGVDCYIDMISGELTGMFIKEKLLMRAGETDKAVSRKNELIQASVLKFLKAYPYQFCGAIDIDIFSDGKRCLISEVNPRFGGGYPHAHECGVDFPSMFRRNLEGKENPVFVELDYEENVAMMKYNEIKVLPPDQLAKKLP